MNLMNLTHLVSIIIIIIKIKIQHYRKEITQFFMKDIQNTQSNYNIYLHKVGINNLLLPMMILQKNGSYQQVTSEISCGVDLAAEIKGISMSRLLEVLHNYTFQPLNSDIIENITEEIRKKSNSNFCELLIAFPFFIQKYAPVSNKKGYIHNNVLFSCTNNNGVCNTNYSLGVTVTSLCPCSKEISDSSAHNQKCTIQVAYSTNEFIWFEDIISELETCGSCEIYSILKRPDEKAITEKAYNNPMFVEDIARFVYNKLDNFKGVESFIINVASHESIHQHDAVASVSKNWRTS
jgi:GTP cyclohydrolase I